MNRKLFAFASAALLLLHLGVGALAQSSAGQPTLSGTVTSNQGSPGAANAPWPVTWQGNPGVTVASSVLPTGAATSAAQASLLTNTPLGTATKAASRPVTPASDLSNIEPAGAPVSQINMPTGGVGITGWLSANMLRASVFGDTSGTVAASSAAAGATRDAGGTLSQWASFNVTASSGVAGTLYIQGSNDGVSFNNVQQVAVSAGSTANLSQRLVYRYNRSYFVTGATGGTVIVNSSYTAN